MYEENELEQIRLRKIQAMIDSAKKGQTPVAKPPIILTDSNFSGAVSANELLVVDFWAPWCGPCRMVGPLIEALSAEYTGKAAFGKMNVDESQVVPSSFGIMSIPTIIIFNHGKEVERLVGAYPKAHIEAMIKRYLG
ncbi:MAG TPA: thioredoxin [Candidatus Bathyarchaeia archaeon]